MVILDKRETTVILEQKQNLHCHYSWVEQTIQPTNYPTLRHKLLHALCYLRSKVQTLATDGCVSQCYKNSAANSTIRLVTSTILDC